MPLIESAIQEMTSYGEKYNVKHSIISSLPNAYVFADQFSFLQVMSNLLSNATNFPPVGASVEVSVAYHNKDYIKISITDYGLGIEKQFYNKIFDKFTQSDSTDMRPIGGTGLGLNISKIIVEKHGVILIL